MVMWDMVHLLTWVLVSPPSCCRPDKRAPVAEKKGCVNLKITSFYHVCGCISRAKPGVRPKKMGTWGQGHIIGSVVSQVCPPGLVAEIPASYQYVVANESSDLLRQVVKTNKNGSMIVPPDDKACLIWSRSFCAERTISGS